MNRSHGLAAAIGVVVCLFAGMIGPGRVRADDLDSVVVQAEQQRIAAIAKAKKSAVSVFANGGHGGGSGVVVTADGYALTNFHVSKPAGTFMKCSMPDGVLYDAVIVGLDPTGDVALIKLLGRDDFPVAELGDSDTLRVGDWCFAIGNPFLLATDFQPTVTYGIVSGVHRYQYPAGTLLEYADCIQTDASINPGNSGGPLFNADGQLVGINGRGSFEKRGRVNVGVGYAISINQIKNFMGYLRSGRIVDHATLGATVSRDDVDGRVVVTNILESSDAYRRGLRFGDEIVEFAGRPITTVNAFKNALGIFPKGWRVPLSYRRDGQRFETFVRLAGVHSKDELISQIQRKKQDDEPHPDKQPDRPPDEENPPRKLPLPIAGRPDEPPVPPEIAQFYQPREGFANYYFNQQNRDRVWQAFTAQGQFAELTGTWRIEAALEGGGPVEMTLADDRADARFPAGPSSVNTENLVLGDQLAPVGSGGLLVALHLWRRLLTVGPAKFGDVYYVGTAPLPGHEGLVDVLSATYKDVEARFLFDPASGGLLALEMIPGLGVDPCEVYFYDDQQIDGRALPRRMEVRVGENVFAVVEGLKFELSKSVE